MGWNRSWDPYVPVAERKRRGTAKAKKKLRKGEELTPIKIATRKMATTFWGQGWCNHFERRSDYANRLPRGKTYARNGSIAHLQIEQGKILAYVCGSQLYTVKVTIDRLPARAWRKLCDDCSASVHSLIDLMLGELPEPVIEKLSDPENGMFPKPKEMKLSCSCPDGARICKHLAAVLYGVGNRLDDAPELLFVLRGVNQQDLIGKAIQKDSFAAVGEDDAASIDTKDLGDIFGIDIASDTLDPAKTDVATKKSKVKRVTKGQATRKKSTKKKKSTKEKIETKKKTKKKTSKKKTASKRTTKSKMSKRKPK